jgi:hypothetical protein
MVNVIAKGNQRKKLFFQKKNQEDTKKLCPKKMCFSHVKFKFKFKLNPN